MAGFAVAGHDWDRRLANAFLPALGAGGPAATLDAWINPPAYTGEAPIYLERTAKDETVAVPVGSKLVLRVHGAHGTPRIRIDAASPRDRRRSRAKAANMPPTPR